MLEAHIRPKIQPIFNGCARWMILIGLSANSVTLISFIAGVVAGALVACNQLLLALFCLAVSGVCDILDGTIARLKKPSKAGAFMDLISDRLVESAVIFGFALSYPQHYLAYILFLISVLFHFSNFLISGNLFKNDGVKSFHYTNCLVERAEAFVGFFLMMLFPAHIFVILMTLNALILLSATSSFFRVIAYARQIDCGLNRGKTCE